MMRKILILAVFLLSALIIVNHAFAASMAVEYLCDYGIKFYEKGLYNDALKEFNDVLILDPGNKVAKKYINQIFQKKDTQGAAQSGPLQVKAPAAVVQEAPNETYAVEEASVSPSRQKAIDKALSGYEKPLPSVKKVKEKPAAEDIEVESDKYAEPLRTVTIETPLNKPGVRTSGIMTSEEAKINVGDARITGEAQARVGVTSDGSVWWKRANFDLNEKNWRQLDHNNLNQGINTYDPRIYDRLAVNVDSGKETGFGIHSNIVVDPWSFTGTSHSLNLFSSGDQALVDLKYWSNTGYTLNETIYTLQNGDSFQLPEIKVKDGYTLPTTVTTAFGNTFVIPETKIHRTFQPLRELWMDYNTDNLKLRFYPIGYENQSVAFYDPLRLSYNHVWWEDSPWIRSWKPGIYNSGATPADFTPGYWDNDLSFKVKDSEGRRLTALRGFTFELYPREGTSFVTSVASPKDPWQDYDEYDNYITASRLDHKVMNNLAIGATATTRTGFNADNKKDAENYVGAADVRFEIMEGMLASMEMAYSRSGYDQTNRIYNTESRGSAYYFSLIGRFPSQKLIDSRFGYDGIQPIDGEGNFTKYRIFASRMDDSFDESLSSYVETRDDEYWSRHLHFRKPLKYYYQGEGQLLTWDDIKVNAIGNGIDIGRSTLGLRVESSLWDRKLENLFDVRNVHDTDGKFIEDVLRDEFTWRITDKLTGKFLGIYNRLPHTKAGVDPFIFNPISRRYYDNALIEEGKDPSIATGSLGLNYDFFDWLGLNGIWEYTNDISLGYDNFPRGLYNDGNRSALYFENDRIYRETRNWLYNQGYFPLPPYPYYNIFKSGLRITPISDVLEFYIDYTRNEYEYAGPIDDNMNHVGLTMTYAPIPKLSMMLKYNYSRWHDADKLLLGDTKVTGHHNIFTEFIYRISKDEDFTFQYGEGSRDPYMGGVLDITWDPYGGDLRTVDTQHIYRAYYRRRF